MIKHNKKIAIYTILSLNLMIFSCTPINSTTVAPTSSPSAVVSSSVPSNNPSASVIATAIPSDAPQPLVNVENINYFQIYSSEGHILADSRMNQQYYYEKDKLSSYVYSTVFNTNEKFTAQVFYKDGSSIKTNDLIWSSTDTNVAPVSNDGSVSTFDKEGYLNISATLKGNENKKADFGLRVYPSESSPYYDSTCSGRNINHSFQKYISTSVFNSTDPEALGLSTLSINVYDIKGVPVKGFTVEAKSVEPTVNYTGASQQAIDNVFFLKSVPQCVGIEITVSKAGYTTRKQIIKPKNYMYGDIDANQINFGIDAKNVKSNYMGSIIDAVQDEPEITRLKINEQLVSSAFIGDKINPNTGASQLLNVSPINLGVGNNIFPGDSADVIINKIGLLDSILQPALTGVDSKNLKIEIIFSEAVYRPSVENNFKLTVQNNSSIKNSNSDENQISGSNFTYNWSSNDSIVEIEPKQALLANKSGSEFRYLVGFKTPFLDKTAKPAVAHKYFRFSSSQVNEFATFSVANTN